MKSRSHISDHPREKAWQDQKRENLRCDHAESCPEIHSPHRADKRNYQRNKYSSKKIYQYSISRDTGHISSQLTCNHGSGSSCRADQAQHCRLYKDNLIMRRCRKTVQQSPCTQSQNSEKATLNEKQPPMPSVRFQILRFYPAESQEKHREYQKRLHNTHQSPKKRTCCMTRLRQNMI